MNFSKTYMMKLKIKTLFFILLTALALTIFSFKNHSNNGYEPISKISVVDIEKEGFDLLNKLQGQWLGINSVAGINYNWFAWDLRPISNSQLHSMFEAGSMGNLFNTFFVADFKGVKTIMVRNGGVLNGIYRSSYFILDKVRKDENGDYYRLVDAVGGKETMYMELRFKKDSLYWNVYNSQLGNKPVPKRHMTFKGKKYKDDLAMENAKQFNFPEKEVAYNFPSGFDNDYLYAKKSATFLWQADSNEGIAKMGKLAGDPIVIDDYPEISSLKINFNRDQKDVNKTLMLYVSTTPLTNDKGYLYRDLEVHNNSVLFSYLTNGEDQFTYTYVLPGNYYITAIVDNDNNYVISKGDRYALSIPVTVASNANVTVNVDDFSKKSKAFIFPNLGNDFYKNELEVSNQNETEIPVIDWEVTYENDVKQIIFNNCLTCHSGPSPSARLDLSNFDELKIAVKHKNLLKRINDKNDPMPPTEMLSLKDRMIVFKWKKDGLNK